ncbi:MAG TPA: TMEM165/GDT1 family protein [Acidimicrobiales bacterium]|nr:TMEM165/GDT1 family protein [Acidimicrobiales bacterium]
MNFGLAAATFAIVIPAELPDKTFLASIVLSARHRPLPVFAGVAAGLVVQAAIAVVAGRLLALAPRRIVDAVVAAVFFGGAAYLWFGKEENAEHAGEEMAAREEAIVAADAAVLVRPSTGVRIAATTFFVVVLAEFGDLTQVLLANLSARTRDATSVFVGAVAAFLLTSALGVALGRTITRFVPLALVRKLSAAVLVGLGVWSAVAAAGG